MDLHSVNDIRVRYARNVKSKVLKSVPCFRFNKKGGSNEPREHAYQHLLLKHACQTCFQVTGRFEEHSKLKCSDSIKVKITQKTSKCC